MKVLVTGAAGVMGRRVTAELAQANEVDELIVTARESNTVERLASIFGSHKVRTDRLDVADTRRFVSLARGVDVVVSAAGPYYLYEIDAVRAVIDAGTHYVSLCDDHVVTDRIAALNGAARDVGVTVISGCGLAPGITNLLAALAAEEIEQVEEIAIAIAASSADSPGRATTLHLLAQMAAPAPAIADHVTEEVRAGTSPKLVYFPDPVGWVETFRSGHPEVTTMPSIYPDLRSLSFRIGLTERAAMDVIRASAAARLLGSEKQRRLWLRFAEPLRPAIEAVPPKGAAWTSARVDVRGRTDGRPAAVSLAVVDHLNNLAAVPLAQGALEVGAGRCPPGVHVPERAFGAAPFLAAVSRRGIRLARLDPAAV